VVLDTDLGSDVDDALALAVLLGSPELDLLGATTVYGDVRLRARLVTGFAALAGRTLTCRPGRGEPLSGTPVWLSGQEGRHFPLPPPPPSFPRDHAVRRTPDEEGTDGVGWLLEQAENAVGNLEIVAIGPLTNLALALRTDPAFAGRIRRVWLMGGNFSAPPDEPAEHNFGSDAVAAAEVIRSGLPITALGVELTRQLRLEDDDVTEIGRRGPLGRQLERETRAWMAYWNEPYDVPHDAVTVVRMLRPDLFTEQVMHVRVVAEGSDAGRVVTDGILGTAVTVVTDLDVPAVRREILDRIRAAGKS
jgi:purine nucleosidase